jgi:hypothetical protein
LLNLNHDYFPYELILINLWGSFTQKKLRKTLGKLGNEGESLESRMVYMELNLELRSNGIYMAWQERKIERNSSERVVA